VDSKDVESYFSKNSGENLSKIFDQYLRTTKVPVLEYKMNGKKLNYRWTNCVDGFDMPINFGKENKFWITATTKWKSSILPLHYKMEDLNKNFYVTTRKFQ
jgi:aminopeptidase N